MEEKERRLTARNDNPEEVHQEKVKPEIVPLGPAVRDVFVVEVEHGCSIVEDITIDDTEAYQTLQRVS
jgi:hypothetical protein